MLMECRVSHIVHNFAFEKRGLFNLATEIVIRVAMFALFKQYSLRSMILFQYNNMKLVAPTQNYFHFLSPPLILISSCCSFKF